MDAAFVAQLRGKGLPPAPSTSFPDAGYIADASILCQNLAFPGDTAEVKRVDMINRRRTRVTAYRITETQAREVMVLSAEIYCRPRCQC